MTATAMTATTATATRARARAGQGGLTLIELMVVVAIIGIIASAAVVTIRRGARPDDYANRLAGMLRETSRKAVAGGAVRADVAVAVTPARTQLRLFYDTDGNQIAVVERLVEDPGSPTASWVEIARSYVPPAVEVAGHSTAPKVAETGLTPDNAFSSGDEIIVQCRPTGECDGVTLYLRSSENASENVRVANLALSGPIVLERW